GDRAVHPRDELERFVRGRGLGSELDAKIFTVAHYIAGAQRKNFALLGGRKRRAGALRVAVDERLRPVCFSQELAGAEGLADEKNAKFVRVEYRHRAAASATSCSM